MPGRTTLPPPSTPHGQHPHVLFDSNLQGPSASTGTLGHSAVTDMTWFEQVEEAIAAIDQAAKMYEHGPARLHNIAFEVAVLGIELAMQAMKQGSKPIARERHDGHGVHGVTTPIS